MRRTTAGAERRGVKLRSEGRSIDMRHPELSRGSGVIFGLIAIALILAIGFFYITKEREDKASRLATETAESAGSPVHAIKSANFTLHRDD